MSRTFADFKAYGKAYMRNRSGAFFAFGFPVILILIFGAIFSASTSKVTLYVQDLDGSPNSRLFIDNLYNTSMLDIKMVPEEVNLDDYIKEKSITVALQIPSGFGAAVNSTTDVNITLKGDPSQSTFGMVRGTVEGVASMIMIGHIGGSPFIHLNAENIGSSQFRYIDFFVPGMIGFITLTSPMFSMASVCAEYRGRGYFKLLGSTPLTKSEWLMAKILWYMVLMFSSIALMYIVALAAFGAKVAITPLAIALIAAGTFLFTSLGMFLGIFVNNPESAAAIANAIGFPMMFLSGTFFPLETMPAYMQAIAGTLPLTYLTQGLRATMVLGNDVTAAIDLGIVLVIGIVFFVLAARAMSWKGK